MTDVPRFVLADDSTRSLQRVELVVGAVVYRVTAFSDGTLRLYDVAAMRPGGANSIIIEPFRSHAARVQAREEDG